REAERSRGVGGPEEPLAVRTDARVGSRAERRPTPRRALGRDEPLVGVWVPAGEHRSEVVALHRAVQAETVSGAAEPPAWLLTTVRVVPTRTRTPRHGSPARHLRLWLEV